ncbi:regulatory ArsR family protein, partial [Dietzia cinnamea]
MHLAQSTVSKHLSCLRDCGLVTTRIEGRSSWFSLAQPARLVGISVSSSGVGEPGGGVAEIEAAGGVEGFCG